MTVRDGRLGLELFDDESIQNPYPLYERMRARGPVHPVGDSGFHAVCTWDAINDVIARPEDFSSNLTAVLTYQDGQVGTFAMGELGGDIQALATADDPAHAIHRRLLVPQFAAKRVKVLEGLVYQAAQQLWDNGIHLGSIEWMSAMANRLPMMIVSRLIGLPDEDAEQIMRWGFAATKLVEGLVGQVELDRAGVATMELAGYISEHFQRAAANPKDNLLGDLAIARAAGQLGDMTALNIMATLFSAGGESTASLIGSAAYMLASRPDVQRHVRENPGLLGGFLEEVLRLEPPFREHYRHVVCDTTLAGVDLRAGDRLLLLWGSANRDSSHFDHPDEFRLDRRDGKGHISFGKGAHFCVGAGIARLEAMIVIGELLRRTSYFATSEPVRWLPSLLVRRLERLELAVAC
ncbi:cytochrome P450 [Mycobacterium cookii]|uniref:Cytochrome P450 n=1 Tax=Mycobacterium cookii TaxID=1775 RepID=A0A7I7KW97_9MYCO|nr:cytochrome P450 [Mycobacterium cookii]MCV7332817.1 cytochrome P450 [Mycobacterium cookii]BBX46203.1 cytochrome P450 [Mycobacterium cookii]